MQGSKYKMVLEYQQEAETMFLSIKWGPMSQLNFKYNNIWGNISNTITVSHQVTMNNKSLSTRLCIIKTNVL